MDSYKDSSINRLVNGMKTYGINLTDLQINQFMDYYELLIQWNKVMNLTAITEINEVIEKHFIDSISITRVISLQEEYVIDVGTGAGFPGLPLKIVFPDTKIVLLDSLNKRVNFLCEVIHTLKLNNITAIHGRAEEYGRDKNYRGCFDICVSRAVAKLSSLSEYCLPFVRKNGYFVPYKSGSIEEEIASAENALTILGAEIESKNKFMLPDTQIERSLILIKKTKHISAKYPRGAGKPTKEPL